MKIVIFGAGNIGRSLVGQLFSRAGYEVVFIDIVDKIVKALNERRKYRIEVKDVHPETVWVENVRAVNGKDIKAVTNEIATAAIMATAVGVDNLRYIYGNISNGLLKRQELRKGPIDIIICENVKNASAIFKEGLLKILPQDYSLDSMVGLVETSIGKMVPIMTEKQTREDPLLIFTEAYNKIIVDKKGFKSGIPEINGIEAKENMAAYVNLKLFVHNMGHAISAYLGYITDPEMQFMWEAISNEYIRKAVKGAMWESGRALIKEYPDEFTENIIEDHIDDLIRRFGNKALGDTIFRVGRDLSRKLSRNDRLIGALLLDTKHSIQAFYTTLGIAAAILFRGKDEEGKLYLKDKTFVDEIYPCGLNFILKEICDLDFEREKNIIANIEKTYNFLEKNASIWFSLIK
jgi:mannitol-1-phosphate 5-dehydrogenase